MTVEQFLFALFAFIICGGAIAVVLSQNIVRMAFFLIISLGSVSVLFFLLHADFVGAVQLMIYVGGTLVLLIFGVMLTASGPYVQIKMSPADGFLAAGIGALFLAMIFSTVIAVDWDKTTTKLAAGESAADPAAGFNSTGTGNTTRPLGLAFLGSRPDKDLGADEESALSAGYLLPFEIISVHLLVVLIGAAYLARAKRRVEPTTSES